MRRSRIPDMWTAFYTPEQISHGLWKPGDFARKSSLFATGSSTDLKTGTGYKRSFLPAKKRDRLCAKSTVHRLSAGMSLW